MGWPSGPRFTARSTRAREAGVRIQSRPPGSWKYCPGLARPRHGTGAQPPGANPASRLGWEDRVASSSSSAQSVHRTYTARRSRMPTTNHAMKSGKTFPSPKEPARTHEASTVRTRSWVSYNSSQASSRSPRRGRHVSSKRVRSRRTRDEFQKPSTASGPGLAARKGGGGG